MNEDLQKVREAATKLLNHVVIYNLIDRVGVEMADFFIDELVRISDGSVEYGALK